MVQPSDDGIGRVGFIGRAPELACIDHLIDPETQWNTLQFFLLTAAGGIGKTRLLQELDQRYTARSNLHIPAILDFDDPAIQITDHLLIRIAETLDRGRFQSFFQQLTKYNKIQCGSVSREQLRQSRAKLDIHFINTFNAVSACRRVLLRLDTTDALIDRADVLDTFLKVAKKLQNTVIIIAGRNAVQYTPFLQEVVAPWGIETMQLSKLPPDDSREYLSRKQKKLSLPDLEPTPEQILLTLCNGKPILLDLAMEWRARGIELAWMPHQGSDAALTHMSGKQKKRLRQAFEKALIQPIVRTTTKVHWAFLAMAWVYPMDCRLLAVLRDISAADAGEIFQAVRSYIFVKKLPDRRLKLHDEMQRLIEEHVWPQVDADRAFRLVCSQRALNYFSRAIEELQARIASLNQRAKRPDSAEKAALPAEQQAIGRQLWVMREGLLKHTLIVDIKKGFALFGQLYEIASTDASIALRPRLIQVVDLNKDHLSAHQTAALNYFRADQHFSAADYDAAQAVLKRLLKKADLPPELTIKCIKLRGNIQVRRNRINAAIEDFSAAVEQSQAHGHTVLLIQSTNALGWAYRQRGDSKQALTHYKAAYNGYLNADKRIKASLKRDYGLILTNMAVLLSETHDTRVTAINMANSAILHWKEIENELELGRGYGAQGICFHRTDHAKQAFEAFENALAIFVPVDVKEAIALILSWRGTQQHNSGDNEKARADLTRSLEIGPDNLRAMTLNRLGRVHMHDSNWNAARTCLEESLKLAQAGPDYKYWLASISRLILVAAKTGEAHRLDHFTAQLEDCFQRVAEPDQNAHGIACLGLAQLALLQNRADRIDLILTWLQRGIPRIVGYGSWARKDIVTRLANLEADFEAIDPAIIQPVGQGMIEYIETEKADDLNYSPVMQIMLRWAEWEEEQPSPGEPMEKPSERSAVLPQTCEEIY